MTQISSFFTPGTPPSFSDTTTAPPFFFCTFFKNELEAEELTANTTFGPTNGADIPDTNLLAKATLASSASKEERNDPSPSLFNAANAGNSHSINGLDFVLGLVSAALTEDMA